MRRRGQKRGRSAGGGSGSSSSKQGGQSRALDEELDWAVPSSDDEGDGAALSSRLHGAYEDPDAEGSDEEEQETPDERKLR